VSLTVGVPAETYPDEFRVAMTPRAAELLMSSGADVVIEAGAGDAAGFGNSEFESKGVRVVQNRRDVFDACSVILQVRTLNANREAGYADLQLLGNGHTVVGFGEPLTPGSYFAELAARGVTSFAMELMPRITRAQSMDALSSMATVAGYKAVLIAASSLPRMFPMLMTAAGTIVPARVLILGAGVAGLQAIATARRLGAVVSAYDVRPAVREQVESLGAKFVALALDTSGAEAAGGYAAASDESFYIRQRELLTAVVREHDVVITTAAIPGQQAPILLTREMVAGMPRGSVVFDLAAERGGNCELTQPGRTIIEAGVTIMGPLNVPSTVPYHASQMYSRNLATFLKHLLRDNALAIDLADEITRETLITHQGEIVHPRVRSLAGKE
jgi:H+-translocating NAD(P) transhydrogenase subunit alpha